MPEQTLKNAIISWLQGHPYWMQYAGNQFLEGAVLSDKLTSDVFQFFLEDAELTSEVSEREEISFVEETEALQTEDDLKIVGIKDITNVNALAEGQAIIISDQLTVIYGGNGTGKSGYTRMLNNAFRGRGDKEILSNVFERLPNRTPSCIFTFQAEDSPFDLKFPDDRTNEAFNRFSIFDTHCIKVHLEQENSLLIIPGGFEFFNKTVSLYQALEEKLSDTIRKRKGNNDFIHLFQHPNRIQEVIIGLSATTDLDELRDLANYNEADAKKLEELVVKKADLLALNIPIRIREYQDLAVALTAFVSNLKSWLEVFSETTIASINQTITSYKHFSELSVKEGIDSLKGYPIKGIGSDFWLVFIRAAKQYADNIEESADAEDITRKTGECIFCLQPLSPKEEQLIETYWQFLQSEAQKQVAQLERQLEREKKRISDLRPVVFDENNKLYNYIALIDPVLAGNWKAIVDSLERNKANLLANIDELNRELPIQLFTNTADEFDPIYLAIDQAIENLNKKNPAAEIAAIEVEIQYLTDKNLLHKLYDKVLEFVANHIWAANAAKKMGAFRTHAVTTKQGELFTQHITERYLKTFADECGRLNAPSTVNISQRNVKGQTLRRLQVANNIANKILSEGEQRAITLADFLTEMQLDPKNRGVIFDDPVSSLDHERRELIARRLAEEAVNRQVIVFTHDIALLLQLQYFADQIDGLNISVTSIRKQGGSIGIIHPDLPWVAQKVGDRIKYLRNALVKLKKIEKEDPEDNYILAAKSWYGLLREAWERTVEERLFKGAIERFSFSVQTNRLKKVSITDQMLNEIEKGMTECSKWVHDSAAGLNPKIPDTAKAEADLAELDEFVKKCPAQ